MPHRPHTPVVLEPEYIEGFRQIYEEKIVFNQTIGLKLVKVTPEGIEARIDMRPELVGHFAYNRIHGGVISAALDAIGSAAVMAALAAKHMDEPPAKRLERFAKLGTIDLRIDYLRPGIGEFFTIHAEALRVGSRVGTSRMEFRGPDGTLMSAGAAAYIVS
ncbi:thioesterase family protein [Limnohabitans radicicola]|uniref:Thioesterase family protein n=1 Tax=Limnohabitans radicicola TaxID=2771427 RepID=A0A927IKV0_9BURK|nr:thioesterase family protein [Limnohabitans radicicola]MBD8049536.1 thioesterase family protein [Limnohabitans radicicola]